MPRGTYDFETSRWTRPVFVGLLWGPREAREWASFHSRTDFASVAKFALGTMRLLAKYDGVSEWWAHNGGNFDTLIIFELADSLGWKIEGAVAQGGRVVRATFRPQKGEKFDLLDSYAVVPTNLAKAGEDFHLKTRKSFQKDEYKIDMAKRSRAWIEKGCRNDCESTLELLETVDAHLVEWGGKLKATVSSSALTVAKHAAIESMGEAQPVIPRDVNEACREAYCGGRVEVFHHTPDVELREYDVTSSYPWSMTQPVPWEFAETVDAPSDLDWEGVTDAEVSVPKCHLPCLPVKDAHGGLYFPTGKWCGTFTNVELRYAISQGVKVKPRYGWRFNTAQPFEEFVAKAFHLKENATGATRQFAKLVLNGAYGKFAEKPEKEKLYIFPDEESAQANLADALSKNQEVTLLAKKTNGVQSARFQLQKVFHWPQHTNFAMASYITARSRILLHGHLLRANPETLAYTDTDSIHAAATPALDAQVNRELGGLKVELSRMRGEYFAPKLYRLRDLEKGKIFLASKGFPVDADSFAKLIKGEKVFRNSFLKVKGQLRRGENKFTRLDGKNATFRAWAGKSMKRCPLPGGGTRPWTIEEIHAGAHWAARSPLAIKKQPK